MVSQKDEKAYKLVSTMATLTENIITPLALKSYSIIFEGSNFTNKKVNTCLSSSDSCSSKVFCCFFPIIRSIHNPINKLFSWKIKNEYSDLMHSLNIITQGLNTRQKEFEDFFNQNSSSLSKSWVYSLENRKLIRKIADYMADNLRDLKNFPYYLIFKYFKAYAKLQKLARRHLKVEKIAIDQHLLFGLENLNRFSKYASGIYGSQLPKGLSEEEKEKIMKKSSVKERFLMFCEIDEKDLVLFVDKAEKYLPAHAVLINHQLMAVVLVIRGTVEKFDIITDLDGDEAIHEIRDYKTGQIIKKGLVHGGMYKSAQNLGIKLKNDILKALNDHPGYSLYISGHSLGAGTTALLTMIWLSDPEIMERKILGLCYAPPPSVSSDLNEILKEFVFSVAFGDDVVTRLSEGSLKDLGQVIRFFAKNDESGSKYSNIKTKSVKFDSSEEEIFIEAYKDLVSTLNNYKLESPGNLLQVYQKSIHLNYSALSNSSFEMTGSFVPSTFCSSIIFTKTVVTDHNTLNYINGPQSYLLQLSHSS